MRSLLDQIGVVLTRDIKARIRRGQITPKSKESGTTLVKSAKLVNSITFATTANQVIVGTNLKYARILHEGGLIRPRNAKFLAIPLTPAAAVRRPREWDNTYISKGIIYRKGLNTSEALYALKKQVTIPARPYLVIPEHTKATIEKLIVAYCSKNLRS
jgi:phage gpG-like protein